MEAGPGEAQDCCVISHPKDNGASFGISESYDRLKEVILATLLSGVEVLLELNTQSFSTVNHLLDDELARLWGRYDMFRTGAKAEVDLRLV